MEPIASPVEPPDELARRIREAKEGSSEVLGQLLELCRKYLLSVADAELESALLPKAGASDLVQESFLEAQRIFDRFEGGSDRELLAWLRGILINKVSEFHRRYRGAAKRRAGREIRLDHGSSESGAFHPSPAGSEPSPSAVYSRNEEAELVRRALDRLPEPQRSIIVWREWEDLSFEEIGKRLDKTPDAARMHFWRAVRRLEAELEGLGEPE